MTQGFSWRCPELFLFCAMKSGSLPGTLRYCWAQGFDVRRQGIFVAWKTRRPVD
jgi:hypothetical protein